MIWLSGNGLCCPYNSQLLQVFGCMCQVVCNCLWGPLSTTKEIKKLLKDNSEHQRSWLSQLSTSWSPLCYMSWFSGWSEKEMLTMNFWKASGFGIMWQSPDKPRQYFLPNSQLIRTQEITCEPRSRTPDSHPNRCDLWPHRDSIAPYLSFRCVRGTEHPPLRRLERTRTTHFSCFLKLGGDSCHHAKSRNIRQTRQHLGHALAVHFKSL